MVAHVLPRADSERGLMVQGRYQRAGLEGSRSVYSKVCGVTSHCLEADLVGLDSYDPPSMMSLSRYLRNRGAGRARSVQALINTGSLSAIRPMLEAACFGDREVRAVATRGLMRLLPRLRRSDRELVFHDGLSLTYRLLKRTHEEQLQIAILEALEEVGDSLTSWHVLGLRNSTRSPQVRTAAERCYESLEERVRSGPEVALRPAHPPAHYEAESMLSDSGSLLRSSGDDCVPADARREPP